jgi:Sec-independent protein translocase protein TatA
MFGTIGMPMLLAVIVLALLVFGLRPVRSILN